MSSDLGRVLEELWIIFDSYKDSSEKGMVKLTDLLPGQFFKVSSLFGKVLKVDTQIEKAPLNNTIFITFELYFRNNWVLHTINLKYFSNNDLEKNIFQIIDDEMQFRLMIQ
jgi:hypothetical protein